MKKTLKKVFFRTRFCMEKLCQLPPFPSLLKSVKSVLKAGDSFCQNETFSSKIVPRKFCLSLCEKCLYSEFFWSIFSCIRTRKTPNTDKFYTVQCLPFVFSLYQINSFHATDLFLYLQKTQVNQSFYDISGGRPVT